MYEVYRDVSGKYRWRLISPSGQVLAQSARAYDRKTECAYWLAKAKAGAVDAGVADGTRSESGQ